MSPARRSHKRRDWPRGLYEPRPGYFVWRHPDTGQTFALGSIPLPQAKHQALQANAHLLVTGATLVERLSGATKTVSDLLADMPVSEKRNTTASRKSMDKVIREAKGDVPCGRLSVADCADILRPIVEAEKLRWAEAIRSRLIMMCKHGMQIGWMTSNPAEVTAKPEVVVKRKRLSLEWFQAIYAKAPEVAEWLQKAMLLAIVTGHDRSTVGRMSKTQVEDDRLVVGRSKTGVRVAIPLDLRLEVLNVSLRDLVMEKPRVVTRLLVHHERPWGNAPVGSQVHPDTLTHAFTEARKLAGIPDEFPDGKTAPTFHEIRSLCKRLYLKQGNVDTKNLLGHLTDESADLYADTRDDTPIEVTYKAQK